MKLAYFPLLLAVCRYGVVLCHPDAFCQRNVCKCKPGFVGDGLSKCSFSRMLYAKAQKLARNPRLDVVDTDVFEVFRHLFTHKNFTSYFTREKHVELEHFHIGMLFNQKNRKSRQGNGEVCFVIDYHPALSALHGIFWELQNIVDLSSNLMRKMPEQHTICLRRPRNLKDY